MNTTVSRKMKSPQVPFVQAVAVLWRFVESVCSRLRS